MFRSESLEKQTSPGLWRSWWSELCFCLSGSLMFAVIIVVLSLYDQQRQPQWALGVTLNAVLALLSTMSKASFMIALAEAMSQWKWNLYTNTHGRAVEDFNLVDLASRSFWGSWLLVGRFNWRHPISMAGLITILSVIISPVTQQAIEYPTRSAGTYGRSSVGISRHWAGEDYDAGVTPVTSALMEGIYSTVDDPPAPLDAECPTSRCSFSQYESLALCAKVADVTDMLTATTTAPEGRGSIDFGGMPLNVGDDGLPTRLYYNTLPNNITHDTNYPFGFSSMPGNSSLAFNDDAAFPSALLHMYLIAATADDRSDREVNVTAASLPVPEFEAFETLFYVCVNRYTTSVEGSKSRTTIVSSTSVPVTNDLSNLTEIPKLQCKYDPWYANSLIKCQYSPLEGNMTLAAGTGDGFSFAPRGLGVIANEVATSCRTHLARFRDTDGVMQNFSLGKASLWLREALYGPGRNITDPKEQLDRLRGYYDGIATSISNTIRSSEPIDKFPGTAWEPEVFVNVRWGWLGFLAAELVTATAFVVFSTMATRHTGVPVLKSSSMATLLALDGEVHQILGSVDELSRAEDKAKQTRVRFNDGTLMLAMDEDRDTREAAPLQEMTN